MNCKFENRVFGGYTGSQYTCVLLNDFKLQQHGKEVTRINGQHGVGKSNADVKGIWADGKNLIFIPKDVDKFFPNIIALVYNYASIIEVHEEDFKPFPNLRMTWMTANQIDILEENLFRNNPKLGEISFANNKIRLISVNTFSSLKALSYLYLDQNECIDSRASSPRTVRALVYDTKFQCFPIEADPKFEAIQRINRELKSENEKLKQEYEAVVKAKTVLENLNKSMEAKLKEADKKLKSDSVNHMQQKA